ncbi:MAG: hypothetical protein LC798_10805 [Chloroflexi bacterium]|nr:hypothetical protein [Chloroflexota bacterium]
MTAITAAEVLWKYSVKTGAAGNATAGTAAGSLGKYISTTAWAGGALNDLFDDVTGAENAASTVDYRCLFIHNSNAANAYQAPKIYISAETAGGASIALATDNIAASALGASAAQAAEIATETTAPTGVSAFSSPTTSATGLALSDIPSGQVKALWVRRTAANTAALSNDGVTLAVTGDTGSL